ncbi:MAG: hypothetical protein JO235_14410 [Chroococcidiopsidaceae cyanobacterium CP_BM_RX_35]|nr:hypothetical protein [Chroococcidiopsidaceae cyanobacterium CP_BM_RX_35]
MGRSGASAVGGFPTPVRSTEEDSRVGGSPDLSELSVGTSARGWLDLRSHCVAERSQARRLPPLWSPLCGD